MEADLFEAPTYLEDEKITEIKEEDVEKEEELAGEQIDIGGHRDAMIPAGWRRFRRRISNAFRRVGDRIRRAFRGPWNVCFPTCRRGVRRPGQWNA